MSDDGSLLLLLLGPAGATGLYWGLYRHYRNTDKSHGFERETAVHTQPVGGTQSKIGEVKGTRETSIAGSNERAFRKRVERIRREQDLS